MSLDKASSGRISIPSKCGNFVAKMEIHSPVIDVYKISSRSNRLHRTYDLGQLVKKHISNIGIGSFSNIGKVLNVSLVRWENIVEGATSTKFGVLLDRLTMVLIFDIRQEAEPIVIHLQSTEGILEFRWVPPVPQQDGEDGAYTNSKQILVYTRHRLQVKLYSLDCTQVLWTLDRPVLHDIILRPGVDNSIWSLIVESPLPRSVEAAPVIYHFHNEGSISTLLYRFKLAANAGNALTSWSNSGKWLCNLNFIDNLFGFELQIYNALGVFRNQFNQVSEVPVGDPIIGISYFTDGIVDELSDSSLVSYGSLEYRSGWIHNRPSNAEYLLVASIKEVEESCKVELLLISIQSFGIINKSIIPDAPIFNVWKQFRDPVTRAAKYRNTLNKTLLMKHGCKFENLIIHGTNNHNWACLQFEEIVLLYQISIDDSNENSKSLISYQFRSAIHITSKVIDIRFFGEDAHDVQCFIVSVDHIVVYDFVRQSLETIYQSTLSREIKSVGFFPQEDEINIVTVNDHTERINWQVITHTNKSKNLQTHTDPEDDSNFSIMKKFRYLEDNPKVVGLMRDVQHKEWGQGLRIKRNRFNDPRLSLIGAHSLDDITDTFSLQKRAKK